MAPRARRQSTPAVQPQGPGFLGDKVDPEPNDVHTFGAKSKAKAAASPSAEEENHDE